MLFLATDSWQMRTTLKKGRGIFVTKDIPAGTIIGDYIGTVIHASEEDRYESDNGFYTMYYHDSASVYPTNIAKPGLHIINHSCTPNTWMYSYKGHTLYFAIRHIFKGEELTVSYMLSPRDEACNPCTHSCVCESVICTKTMHLTNEDYKRWKKFDDELSKKTKRERIQYGKELPLLTSYPKNIPDDPIYTLFGNLKQPSLVFTDKELPPVDKLRGVLRETGKTLLYPAAKKRVLGVQNGIIISEVLD